jgi:hypothetical protein
VCVNIRRVSRNCVCGRNDRRPTTANE